MEMQIKRSQKGDPTWAKVSNSNDFKIHIIKKYGTTVKRSKILSFVKENKKNLFFSMLAHFESH